MMSPLQKAHALTQRRKAATIFDLLQKNSNQFHPSQSLIFCRAIFILPLVAEIVLFQINRGIKPNKFRTEVNLRAVPTKPIKVG
jgi:hypothetical protein